MSEIFPLLDEELGNISINMYFLNKTISRDI